MESSQAPWAWLRSTLQRRAYCRRASNPLLRGQHHDLVGQSSKEAIAVSDTNLGSYMNLPCSVVQIRIHFIDRPSSVHCGVVVENSSQRRCGNRTMKLSPLEDTREIEAKRILPPITAIPLEEEHRCSRVDEQPIGSSGAVDNDLHFLWIRNGLKTHSH